MVNELWVVAVVAGDSIIVCGSLILVRSVWGNVGDIAGNPEHREGGRHVGQDLGPRRGGGDGEARVLMFVAHLVNALEGERGQF